MNQGILSENCVNKNQLFVIRALQERKLFFLEEFLNMETQINNLVNLSSRLAGEAEILKNEMILLEIQSFYEVTLVVEALKQQKTVFLDLTWVAPKIAQRIVDFLAGGAYAVDCEQTCINDHVLVLTPSSVLLSQLVEQE